jgi:hypothetical protein
VKRDLKYYLLLTSCLLALILFELLTPPAIDWSPSFSAVDKVPYGSHILFRLLPHLFPDSSLETINQPIFLTLQDQPFGHTNYLFINSEIELDEAEAGLLLEFVAAGNHVFIAAQQFEGSLGDTLNIDTARNFFQTDSLATDFANAALKSDGYRYRSGTVAHYFSSFDSTKTTVLGLNGQDQVNFIKVRWGQGVFWLNCIPLAFTNYNLLAGVKADYVFKALSHLPVQDTLWDEYYKVGRRQATTPMRYVLKRAPLKWAFYLGIVTLLAFIAFEARRKQRIIPVIQPPSNHTLEFVQTVGRLYYQQRDHKNIAAKKIRYFLEYLRTHLGLEVRHPSREWSDRVAQKTALPAAHIAALFDCLQRVQQATAIDDGELNTLNGLLEHFYDQQEAVST